MSYSRTIAIVAGAMRQTTICLITGTRSTRSNQSCEN